MKTWKTRRRHWKQRDLSQRSWDHIEHDIGRGPAYAGTFDHYLGLSNALRGRLMERWVKTQRSYYNRDAKRVYYLSLEFLIGRDPRQYHGKPWD